MQTTIAGLLQFQGRVAVANRLGGRKPFVKGGENAVVCDDSEYIRGEQIFARLDFSV